MVKYSKNNSFNLLLVLLMAKNKQLLAIGATAASCAAAAAGYSLFNYEKKPEQPNKKLIESAKDTIVEIETSCPYYNVSSVKFSLSYP